MSDFFLFSCEISRRSAVVVNVDLAIFVLIQHHKARWCTCLVTPETKIGAYSTGRAGLEWPLSHFFGTMTSLLFDQRNSPLGRISVFGHQRTLTRTVLCRNLINSLVATPAEVVDVQGSSRSPVSNISIDRPRRALRVVHSRSYRVTCHDAQIRKFALPIRWTYMETEPVKCGFQLSWNASLGLISCSIPYSKRCWTRKKKQFQHRSYKWSFPHRTRIW